MMIVAVVDTNVLVRGAIVSHANSASAGVLDAFFENRFTLLLSTETLQEIQRVLSEPEIRAKHGWSHSDVLDFCLALQIRSRIISPTTKVAPALVRDLSDLKWIALAIDGDADYLVTKDRRHLERLKKAGRTRILRPRKFLDVLDRQTE